jgi:hypothetical protein
MDMTVPDWTLWVVLPLLVLAGFACLALLAQEAGRDAARTIAAAYWMGQGDTERAREVLLGRKDRRPKP